MPSTGYPLPGVADLPVGRGPDKVVGTNDLSLANTPTRSGGTMVGYDGDAIGVGQITVQAALDLLGGGGSGTIGNRLFSSTATSDIYVGDWSGHGGGTASDATGDGTLAAPFATLLRAERATAWVPSDTTRTLRLAPGNFTLPFMGGSWRNVVILGFTATPTAVTVGAIIQNDVQHGCGFNVVAGWPGANSERGKLILWLTGARTGQYGWIYKNTVGGDTWVTTGNKDFTAVAGADTFGEVALQTKLTFTASAVLTGDAQTTIRLCQVEGTGTLYTDGVLYDRCLLGDPTSSALVCVVIQTGAAAELRTCYVVPLGTNVNAEGFLAVQPGGLAQVDNGSVLDGIRAVAGTANYCSNQGVTLFYGEVVLQNLGPGGFATRSGGFVGKASLEGALGSALGIGALACTDAVLSWNPPANAAYSPASFFTGGSCAGDLPPLYQRGGVNATAGSYCLTAQSGAFVNGDSSSNAVDATGTFTASADGGTTAVTRTGSTRLVNTTQVSAADGNNQAATTLGPVTVSPSIYRTYILDTTAGAANLTANLPAASTTSKGTRVTLVHPTTDGHDIVIHPNGVDTVQGVAGDYSFGRGSIAARTLECNGTTGWTVVAQADTPVDQSASVADSSTLAQTNAFQTFDVTAALLAGSLAAGTVVEVNAIARVSTSLDGGATQFTTKLQLVDSGGAHDLITSPNSALVTAGSRIWTTARFTVRGNPGAAVGFAGMSQAVTNEATPKIACAAPGTTVQTYATNAAITFQMQAKSDANGAGNYVLESLTVDTILPADRI